MIKALKRLNTDTPHYHLCGRFIAKVISVYDGDTCRVAIPYSCGKCDECGGKSSKFSQFPVRMLGYDAPEVTGEYKEYGEEVTDVLKALILNKIVILDVPCVRKKGNRKDPYGRLVGTIHIPDQLRNSDSSPCCGRGKKAPYSRICVRGKTIITPGTYDAKNDLSDEYLSTILNVNDWMIYHGKVKKCGSKRPEWTEEELINGI